MDNEPRPLMTTVGTFATDPIMSFITRLWRTEDARRCRLCPSCAALLDDNDRASCFVATPGFISDEDAAMHRLDTTTGDIQGETTRQ